LSPSSKNAPLRAAGALGSVVIVTADDGATSALRVPVRFFERGDEAPDGEGSSLEGALASATGGGACAAGRDGAGGGDTDGGRDG
jgi:hypothetical protein